MKNLAGRVAAIDWRCVGETLDQQGFAVVDDLLDAGACASLVSCYQDAALFRKKVIMAKQDYGRGEYQYFNYPLPAVVAELRATLFPYLATIANHWCDLLGLEAQYPHELSSYLAQCHAAGQTRPTPLILRYGPGDFNRLHRDLYGEVHFPLQVAVLLNQPGTDFEGGEFVLVEQKPRSQSRASVVPLTQGSAVIFAVNECPRPGARGYRRLKLSHGVSEIRHGQRHTLGIIFHDAQ